MMCIVHCISVHQRYIICPNYSPFYRSCDADSSFFSISRPPFHAFENITQVSDEKKSRHHGRKCRSNITCSPTLHLITPILGEASPLHQRKDEPRAEVSNEKPCIIYPPCPAIVDLRVHGNLVPISSQRD
jgi:hypothetical protein